MSEINYILRAEVPNLECPECGNASTFTVTFNESTLIIEYEAGKRPIVMEWRDTGSDIEVTCNHCGSQDIALDEMFLE